MATTYVRINLPTIVHNAQQVLGHLASGARLMAVVKGNAYGHGLVRVAHTCVEAGAEWLGVSYVEEGVKLRQAGITTPILAFVPPLLEQCELAVQHQVTVTVTSEEHLAWLREAARQTQQPARGHIFVDADLGRPSAGENLIRLVEIVSGFPQLIIDGVYTHFGAADGAPMPDMLDVIQPGSELRVFAATVKKLARQYLNTEIVFHAAASAMFLTQPEAHLDMVRVGTLLYGQYPVGVPERRRRLDLRATFELRSTIVAVEELPQGTTIGYGKEFTCRRPTRVATLPIGYLQGLSLMPESLARRRYGGLRGLLGRQAESVVVIDDQEAPLIGRIGMDQCAVDVTDVPGVEVGTEVTIPTRRTVISPDVPRVYIE